MASRTVEYIFQLVDRFSAQAQKMAGAAVSAEKPMHALGSAMNRVEAQGRGAAAAIARNHAAAVEASPALQRLTNELHKYGDAGRVAASSMNGIVDGHKRLIALQKEAALTSQYSGGGPGRTRTFLGEAMNIWATGAIVSQAVHHVSRFMDQAEGQFVGKMKMGMVGYKGDLMTKADLVADQQALKYGLKKSDVLEMMYEGVAIHGNAEHALENIEAQTKLATFLQVWDGGKHAGRGNQWSREVFSWIKSMEQFGVLNELNPEIKKAEIDKYIGSGMAMKTLYGDQAKLSEYLTAQRRAGQSFYEMNENWRMNILPALVQEVGGPTIGQQAMTAYQTIAGGTKHSQTQIAKMKQYGLADRTGRFVQSFQEEFKDDPTRAAADLMERAAKMYKLDPNNADQLKALKKHVLEDLPFLFPNRNAAALFANLVKNPENIKKHIAMMKDVRKDIEELEKGNVNWRFKTKAGAEAGVANAFSNLEAELGSLLRQPYIKQMQSMFGWLNKATAAIAEVKKNNPDLADAVGSYAMLGGSALGGWAGLRAAKFMGNMLLGSRVAGILGKLVIPVAVAFAAYEIYQNWGTIKKYLQNPVELKVLWPNMPEWMKNLIDNVQAGNDQWSAEQRKKRQTAALDTVDRLKHMPHGARERLARLKRPEHPDFDLPAFVDEQANEGARRRSAPWRHKQRIESGELRPNDYLAGQGMFSAASSIPAGEAHREIAIRSTIDLQQSQPLTGTVRVQVTGTVNGQINGSGEGTITGGMAAKSNAGRGESATFDRRDH